MPTVAEPESSPSPAPRYVVRCGAARALHVATAKAPFRYGDQVVVRTQRGMEIGEVLCEATDKAVAYIKDPLDGKILRAVSDDDANDLHHIADQRVREFEICKQHISRLRLQMKLVDVERLFGGERVVVYYLAENRVDFRQLVRDLARELQTRIEMRQIGVRDEARLLADYGDCGKPVCCNTHLSAMPPVSMRMAKLQKATLDPSKISGRCGRLKCCLRYEFDTYEELQRELPPPGSEILTRDGKSTVIYQEILAQQLLVRTEDNRRVLIDVSDVLTVVKMGLSDDNRKKAKDRTNSQPNLKNKKPPSNSGGEKKT